MDSMIQMNNFRELDKIVDRIYIGCYAAATMLDYSNRNGITHVLNCTPDAHEGLKKFKVSQLNINDGEEMPADRVHFAIRMIDEAVRSGGKILVHCHAGISRSTSLVCGYLMYCGMSWDEALWIVRSRRPQAYPHPKIELSVKEALGQVISPSSTLLGGRS